MDIFSTFLKVFVVGGLFCVVGQLLIDKTNLTPARIMTSYVVIGVIFGAVGVYEPLASWAGAGATVPLTGFGYTLAKGVKKAIDEHGAIGILTGGLSAAAGGVSIAMLLALVLSLFSKSSDKS